MPPPLRDARRFGIHYRPMTDDDLPFAEDLYASTRAEELALSGWPIEEQRSFLGGQHRLQHQHYRTYYPTAEWLIIEQGDERIGRLYLDEWSDQFRIVDISLVPACRGQGIGGAILADILAAALAIDKGVSIHVEKANPARRLYERLGFAVAEDKGVYDLMEWNVPVEGGQAATS